MRHFKIKKNEHRSGIYFKPLIGNKILSFNATFKDNCRYDLGQPDQQDINKLIGFSYGYHHNNSIRIGWRYNTDTDKIDLLPYIYTNGLRLKEDVCPVIASINVNETVYGMLSYEKSNYRIILYTESGIFIENYYKVEDIKCTTFGYMLYPYFGGNKTAPHDINIDVEFSIINS